MLPPNLREQVAFEIALSLFGHDRESFQRAWDIGLANPSGTYQAADQAIIKILTVLAAEADAQMASVAYWESPESPDGDYIEGALDAWILAHLPSGTGVEE
jgi:hypothetical protein